MMDMHLHTINEVCERLRIGKTMFHSLVKTGRLSTVKIGRRTFVSSDELDRFLVEIVATSSNRASRN